MLINELKKAYEAANILEELNIPVSDEQQRSIKKLERQYLREEVIPTITKEMAPFLSDIRSDFVIDVFFSKTEGLQLKIREKEQIKQKRKTVNNDHFGKRVKYSIDGEVPVFKNRLVWEVVRKHIESHLDITYDELNDKFPYTLSGSYINGVVRRYDDVLQRAETKPDLLNRFFVSDEDILTLHDGTRIVVNNQWGHNFATFLAYAKTMHNIEIVE